MNKIIIAVVMAMLAFITATSLILYTGELNKVKLLRTEIRKTADETRKEVENTRQELKETQAENAQERKKLLDQVAESIKLRDEALDEKDKLVADYYDERKMSLTSGEDIETLRDELAILKKQSRQEIILLQEGFKKKKQDYDTKLLSLDAQLGKARQRLTSEADRYHYNLAVLYVQNKDFDLAVQEFKDALAYNPDNAMAHYNLGIIYDDYFKDVENAKYHYRRFLELSPTSDDAESVKEWLANLD